MRKHYFLPLQWNAVKAMTSLSGDILLCNVETQLAQKGVSYDREVFVKWVCGGVGEAPKHLVYYAWVSASRNYTVYAAKLIAVVGYIFKYEPLGVE